MSNNVKVACCQVAPQVGDVAYNQQITTQAIKQAASQGAQIIVLPELAQSGYLFKNTAEAWACSETATGPTLQEWCQLAKSLNLIIIGGFCEQLANKQVANSAVFIDPQGIQAIYRKVHLWDNEKNIFVAGNTPPPIITTPFGKIAMMICYDLEFPEWVRLLALQGIDLLCAPVNWPDSPRPSKERPMEMVRVQANASVNRCFIAVCDRHGVERGVDWVSGSIIVDPDGYPIAYSEAKEAALLLADLALEEAHNKWVSKHNHVHQDRIPYLYTL